ncbi:MAG: ribonuclease R [Chlorobiota bacterium]
MGYEALVSCILDYLNHENSEIDIHNIPQKLKKRAGLNSKEIINTLENLIENNVLVLDNNKVKLKDYSSENIEGFYNYSPNHCFVLVNQNNQFYKVTIPKTDTNYAINGDKVLIEYITNKKKKEGKVKRVLSRKNDKVSGTIEISDENTYLKVDPSKYQLDFVVNKEDSINLSEGDIVEAEIITDIHTSSVPRIKITNMKKRKNELKDAFDSILIEYGLNQDFPKSVIKETNKAKQPTAKSLPKQRIDIREKNIFTIDPFDAKDFDDAISLDCDDDGNKVLGVHIADVSHYVAENSVTDIEARERGNSTYLVDRVVPMLPEKLSNDLCSLKPNVDRYAFSVFMTLDNDNELIHYELTESLINSKRRYSYEEALEVIEGKDDDNDELLRTLTKISQELRKKRFENGGINFSSSEVKFILDENRIPVDNKLKTPTKATQMIEEFMLLANRAVTLLLIDISKKNNKKGKLPFIYRVHEDPDRNLVNEAIQFIGNLTKTKFKKISEVKASELNNIINKFQDSSHSPAINQVLIRSMAKAIYSQRNYGHFGLGFENYTHFTSPIRRYADLVVHRLLKEYMNADGKISSGRIEYLKPFVKSISDHISATERNSMEAERTSNKLASVILVRNKVGEEYIGTVTGILNFGLFLLLEDLNVEGLLHIKELNDDYYRFDEKNLKFVGKRNKKVFTIGTRVKVKIANANIAKSQIDFKFIEKV